MELRNEGTPAAPSAPVSGDTAGTKSRSLKKTSAALWFLLPSLIILAVFTFYPMIATLVESTFSTNIRGELANFVGLNN